MSLECIDVSSDFRPIIIQQLHVLLNVTALLLESRQQFLKFVFCSECQRPLRNWPKWILSFYDSKFLGMHIWRHCAWWNSLGLRMQFLETHDLKHNFLWHKAFVQGIPARSLYYSIKHWTVYSLQLFFQYQ